MNDFSVGKTVLLKPITGCYQKDIEGTITKETAHRFFVEYDSGIMNRTIEFNKKTCYPYRRKNMVDFPCYRVVEI